MANETPGMKLTGGALELSDASVMRQVDSLNWRFMLKARFYVPAGR